MSTKLKEEEIKVLKLARDTLIKFLKLKKLEVGDNYIATAAGHSNTYRLTFTGITVVSFHKMQDEINELEIRDFKKPFVIHQITPTVLVVDLQEFVGNYLKSKKDIPDVEVEKPVFFGTPKPFVPEKVEPKILKQIVKKETPIIATVAPVLEEKTVVPIAEVEKPAELVEKVTTNQIISPKEAAKTENKRVNFLKNIRIILGNVIPVADLQKHYILKKYEGKGEAAEILISDRVIMHKALTVLEANNFFFTVTGTKVITSPDWETISFIDSYKRIESAFKECSKFVKNVKKWMDNNKVVGEINTHPFLLAQSVYSEEMEIECANSLEAQIAEQLFLVSGFQVKKNVRMVYVQLTRALIVKPFIHVEVKRENFQKPAEGMEKEGARNIYTSTDYDDFHLLAFNRKIDPDHVDGIARSIKEFGIIDFVKIAYTDCVDGTFKNWIADGQHTFSAEKKLKLPIVYIIIKVNTLYELIRLIAVLNNRRKLWTLLDYLHAWMSLKVSIYERINHWVKKEKLPMTMVLETVSGKDRGIATEDLKDGNFRENESINYEEVLGQVAELKPLLPRSNVILRVLSKFIRNTQDFDISKMKFAIKKNNMKALFGADDLMAETSTKIKDLYNDEIKI